MWVGVGLLGRERVLLEGGRLALEVGVESPALGRTQDILEITGVPPDKALIRRFKDFRVLRLYC